MKNEAGMVCQPCMFLFFSVDVSEAEAGSANFSGNPVTSLVVLP